MIERYLLDVPVYRESEDAFHAHLAEAIEARLVRTFDAQGISRSAAPDSAARIEERVRVELHAPWKFNQIIGWIRVYTLGASVRGESWWTSETRVRRKPAQRRIEFSGNAFELTFHDQENDATIAREVRSALLASVRDFARRGLSLDLEAFDNVAPLLPWNSLLTDPCDAT